jgi:transposase
MGDRYLNGLNPLSPELNPICYLLAILAHDFLHVSRIRVKSLTLKLLMSYIYDISSLRVKLRH